MPIYLYIKTHNITGLKYFGKTTKPDPHKYTGSGIYWKKHLKVHGKLYSTEIVGVFEDTKVCEAFALDFSKRHNIVDSKDWANLQEENGYDGAPKGHAGHKFTDEQLLKLSESSKEKWSNTTYKQKMIDIHKKRWTPELKEKQSKRLINKKRPEHSKIMKAKKIPEGFKCIDRTAEHKINISNSLKGIPKSDEHKKNLSKPKTRICRIHDRKETTVNAYSRWLKTISG
jgi:hypothetical protein